MPNLNVGLFVTIWPAYAGDCAACESLIVSLEAACERHGGHPTCVNEAWNQIVYEVLRNFGPAVYYSGTNSFYFDSPAAVQNWAAYLIGLRGRQMMTMYYNGGSANLTCQATQGACCTLSANDTCTPISSNWIASSEPGLERNTGSYKQCTACGKVGRCAAGFYGNPYDSIGTQCLKCPTLDKAVVTSNPNSFGIVDCYMPAGQNLSDNTGSYTLVSSCYYGGWE